MKGQKRKPLETREDDQYSAVHKRSRKSSRDSLLSVVLANAENQSLRLAENQNGNQIKIECIEKKPASLLTEVLWNQTFILPTNVGEAQLPEGFMSRFFHDTFDWEVFGLQSYEHHIFQEQYQLEQLYRIHHASYVRQHPEFLARRRAGLVDFLVTLCRRLELDAHCVCKTVNLLDRYLSKVEHVFPKEITAIGVACVMIVMKYEYCGNFPLEELCKMICREKFAGFKSNVIALEYRILTSIDWHLHAPTSTMFLRRYYRIVPLTSNLQYRVAQCLCERVLFDPSLTLQFTPSVIAATCVMMASSIASSTDGAKPMCSGWNENMQNYTTYQAQRDIMPCLTLIQAALRQETTTRALRYVKQQQTQIMNASVEYFEFSWFERVVLWSQQEIADKEALLSTMRARSQCREDQLDKLKQRQKYLMYLPAILEAAARKTLHLPALSRCCTEPPPAYCRGLFSPLLVAKNSSREKFVDSSGMTFLLSAATTNNADDSMASGITDCAMETSLLSTPSTKEDSPAIAVDVCVMEQQRQSAMYEVYDAVDTMLRETVLDEVMHDAVMIRYPDAYCHLVTFPPCDV